MVVEKSRNVRKGPSMERRTTPSTQAFLVQVPGTQPFIETAIAQPKQVEGLVAGEDDASNVLDDYDDASTILTTKSVDFDIALLRRGGSRGGERIVTLHPAYQGLAESLAKPVPRRSKSRAMMPPEKKLDPLLLEGLDSVPCIDPYTGRQLNEGYVPRQYNRVAPSRSRSMSVSRKTGEKRPSAHGATREDSLWSGNTSTLDSLAERPSTQARRRRHPSRNTALPDDARGGPSTTRRRSNVTTVTPQTTLHASTATPKWKRRLDEVFLPHDKLYRDLSHSNPVDDVLDLSEWKLSDDDLGEVGKRNSGVKALRLAHCTGITDSGIASLCDFACLTELNVNNCPLISDRALEHIRKHAPKLEVVDLSNCPLLTEAGFASFIGSCRYLSSLTVRNFGHLEDIGMQALSDSIRSRRILTELDVSGCRRFSNESLLKLLEHGGGILKRLNLNGCRQISDLGLIGLNRHGSISMEVRSLDVTDLNLHDSAVHWITAGCKYVRRVNFEGSSHITEEGWVALGALDYLRDVNLSGCTGLTPMAFRDIFHPSSRSAGSGNNLRSLDLTRCVRLDDDCLVVLGAKCKNLESLVLVGVSGLTDVGLQCLGRGCTRLETLNLAADTETLDLSLKSRVPQFTTAGVEALGRSVKSLRSLVLTSATRVRDGAFQALAVGCPHLEHLRLQRCLGVSDKSLVAFGRTSSQLMTLDLAGCKDISDKGISALGRGCPRLVKVSLVGCRNVNDSSIKLLVSRCSALETLSLMNCDLLTDDVPLELSRSICRCSLTSLNLRGVGELTDLGILALRSCTGLTTLDVTFCIDVTDVALRDMARELPFAKVLVGGRRGLGPLARGVRLFNEVALERQRMARAVELFQRKGRRHQAKKRFATFRAERIGAVVVIQKYSRAYLARSRVEKQLAELRRQASAAIMIQSAFRNFVSVRLAMAVIKKRRGREGAAACIQRSWTCAKYRHAAKYARRRKARLIGNWAHFTHEFQLLLKNRATAKSAVYCQRTYRKGRLEKLERCYGRDTTKIQCAWRCYLSRVEYKKCYSAKYHYLMEGALLIQRVYLSKKNWGRIIKRVRREEREWVVWRLSKMKVAFFMNDFFRAFLWRVAAKRELSKRRLHRDRAKQIQGAMRAFMARFIVRRARTHKLQVEMRWKTMTRGVLNLRLHRSAVRIQREYRKYGERKLQNRAARKLQRAYRGFKGRSSFFDAMLHYRKDMARRIQGAWRAFMAKNIVANIHRIKYASAACIQHFWYRRRQWLLFKAAARKAIAEKAAAHRLALAVIAANRTEEFARKFFEVGFERVVGKIQKAFREHIKSRRAAHTKFMEREQRYRRLKDDEDRRNAANRGGASARTGHGSGGLLVQIGWSKTSQQKQIESKTAKIRKDLDAVIEEESAAAKVLRLARGQTQTNQELKEFQQAQQLSILNRQSKSVQQVGVVEMKFTVGKIEHDDFATEMKRVERENRAIKYQNLVGFGQEKPMLPIFVKIDRDLTGKAKKHVHLWVMQGSGKWVWASMTIQRAPTAHTNAAANKSRVFGMREAGYIIVNHEKLDIEIQGYAPLAVGESGSALDNVVLIRNDDEWAKAEKKGFLKLEKHLGAFGLQKNWFLAYHKKEYRDQPILHQVTGHYLGGQDWYNEKLNHMVESYSLTIDDVVSLRKNFMAIDIGKESVIDIMQVFTFHGEKPGLRFGPWFMHLIESRLDDRMDFGEYVCLICSVACMQKNEVHRWIYKCIDSEATGFLEKDKFEELCGILMDEEVTGYHTRDAVALWAHPHLGGKKDNNQDGKVVMYYPEFCKLITSFTALVYPVFRVQDKFRESNLGRNYWARKLRAFTAMRKNLKLPRNKSTS